MDSIDTSDIVRKAEAVLASAKSFDGQRAKRYELMQQVDILYQELEDPMDGSMYPLIFLWDPKLMCNQCLGNGLS